MDSSVLSSNSMKSDNVVDSSVLSSSNMKSDNVMDCQKPNNP